MPLEGPAVDAPDKAVSMLEVPARELDETRELVRDCMMNAVPVRVPLKVDFGHGKNWLEAH